MGFQADDSIYSSPEESVIVAIDANRSKGNVDSLDWAIKNIVRPKDIVLVLVVLSEMGKNSSPACLPHVNVRFSGIWVKIELSKPDEMTPSQLEEDIERKRDEYQRILQPFYRQCKKNKVKLDVKLAVGFNPKQITVEEAYKFNPRWIVLDSHLKKHKVYIYGHVACNVAVMKRKGVATLMPSKISTSQWPLDILRPEDVTIPPHSRTPPQDDDNDDFLGNPTWSPALSPGTPCWYPLSWRTGFPRAFSLHELEEITDHFAKENIVCDKGDRIIYEAIYKETPVFVMRLSANNEWSWSCFKILSCVRHRSIANLVGHCCTRDYIYLLRDYPCNGSLELNLQCDESAKNISWEARWYVALEIGAGLRYLHEECGNGPIVHIALSSAHILFSHDYSALLSMHYTAKWLDNDTFGDDSTQTTEKDEYLFADVRDYGMFLIELLSGKSAGDFQQHGNGQSLIDWALPLVQNGSVSEVMDPRLNGTKSVVVDHIVRAAILCLKNDLTRKLSISEVLAVVRGDKC